MKRSSRGRKTGPKRERVSTNRTLSATGRKLRVLLEEATGHKLSRLVDQWLREEAARRGITVG